MRSAAVVGTGLVGASIGIGLRAVGWEVWGWDQNPKHLAQAAAIGAISRPASSLQEAVTESEFVVLAVSPRGIVSILSDLRTEALVTDVAGVKQPIVEAAAGVPRFVGSHPMAGREVSGPLGASGDLFRGATWVLTTDHASAEDLNMLSDIVRSLDAHPVTMTAANHDYAVALVSHLPRFVAATLVDQLRLTGPTAEAMVAGGFRDLTRIALSGAEWWPELLVANRQALTTVLSNMVVGLDECAKYLEHSEVERVTDLLDSARETRMGLAPPGDSVGVLLDDEPGEIARVGMALSKSGVDIRDLQLRHATHGGGGVLTLAVRPEEAPRLRQALIMAGFGLLEIESRTPELLDLESMDEPRG
ncbi:MAG: prephenate dehydrogenase/arogenate dehydrogenase family protein [Actinomycetia bacterium]|nr:prephenate dehydrogenase/arogenate dehydrogenase family protein [Actinomycetes bacterium]